MTTSKTIHKIQSSTIMQMAGLPQMNAVAQHVLSACLDHVSGVGIPRFNDHKALPEQMVKAIEKTREVFSETQKLITSINQGNSKKIPLSELERASIKAFFDETSSAISLLHEELKKRAGGYGDQPINLERALTEYARKRHQLAKLINGAAKMSRDVSGEQAIMAGHIATPISKEITSAGEIDAQSGAMSDGKPAPTVENSRSQASRQHLAEMRKLAPEGALAIPGREKAEEDERRS